LGPFLAKKLDNCQTCHVPGKPGAGPDLTVNASSKPADWLLDRTQLLGSIGESKIFEYRFVMTSAQFQKAEWVLLAGMPGGTLLLGGLVWLKRRR